MTGVIGDTLRSGREEQGKTLADAAAETRIRQRHLAALEHEDFSAFGGDVYAKGFIRSYARYLGLDPEPLVQAYQDHYRQDVDSEPVGAARSAEPPGAISTAARAALVLVAALVVLGGLAFLGIWGGEEPAPEDPEEVAVPDEPEPEEPTPTPTPTPEPPAEPEPDEETPEPDPEPEPTGVDLELAVDGAPSWLRVVVDGETVLEGTEEAGENLSFSAEEEILLRVGNAGAVRVVVNGEEIGTLGGSGEVVERTFGPGDPS